jgi:arylsulfatase A-like enzyme
MADLAEYKPGETFPGVIGRTVEESSPAWPVPRRAKEGAPNVIFFVLDDVGYGQLSPYGGLVEAPNVERLARNGLRYTNFHTTALCSPTRTCIMTGRNHHSNAMGSISEWSTGFPGYNSRMPFEHGFVSEVLKDEGYNTFAIGKWHLSVAMEETPAGPYDTWPLGRGFERFYGFLGGETDQWYPDLIYDNHSVTPSKTPEEGYHLSEDLADKAIEFIADSHVNAPDKPFFMYYCPGAGHAPHHIFKEWADKYKGKFDMGWDKYRDIVFANQQKLGLLPEGTKLSPRDPDVPEWDSLSDDERKLYARMMEVFAGFVSHADHHFGRILDFLEETGQLDNTLIMFISDNGASPEGGEVGSVNEYNFFNFVPESLERNLKMLDQLGSPATYNHYAWGWAWAGNTPFRRWKKEIYRGGASDAFIVSWPNGITAKGELRHQFGHAIDMAPTVSDALNIDAPKALSGYSQAPIEGVSFARTFDDADAETHHHTQYYEMFGGRSIYHDGWRAVCGWPGPNYATGARGGHKLADPLTKADLADLDTNGWELFHVDNDVSESKNVADAYPEKLEEMIARWWTEAGTYNVLPLDGTMGQRISTDRPTIAGAREKFVYYPNGAPVPSLSQPSIYNRSHVITADISIPSGGAEGVLVASGGGTGGYTLYIKDRKVSYVYNYMGTKQFRITSEEDVREGDVTITYEFETTGKPDTRNGKGAPGKGKLLISGKQVGEVDMDVTVPLLFSIEGMSCGWDYGDGVDKQIYKPPFRFTGTIKRVAFDLSGEAIKDAEAETRKALAKQ